MWKKPCEHDTIEDLCILIKHGTNVTHERINLIDFRVKGQGHTGNGKCGNKLIMMESKALSVLDQTSYMCCLR